MRSASQKKRFSGVAYVGLILILFGEINLVLGQTTSEVKLPPELLPRYETLIAELRCPKCLNVNIADSNAPIAADLRNVVQTQLREGRTNAEIKTFLRQRYGPFIDYDPPFSPGTLVLWLLPLALLIGAGLLFTFIGSKRQTIKLSAEERDRLEKLKARLRS